MHMSQMWFLKPWPSLRLSRDGSLSMGFTRLHGRAVDNHGYYAHMNLIGLV